MSAISRGGVAKVVPRLVYVFSYAWIPIAAVYHLGSKTSGPVNPNHVTVGAVLVVVGTQVMKAIKASASENMQFLSKNYTTRKFSLSGLIRKATSRHAKTPQEIQEFREETLRVIAQYVRDHRADWEGTRIFTNLLVVDRGDIVVLARDQPRRVPLGRRPKSELAAARVFDTGEHVVVGDLASEFPGHSPKPYSSFLVLPIYLGSRIVGAVSIESSEKYHFDFEADELSVFLQPYINLLAWTLEESHVRDALAGDPLPPVDK